MKSVSSYISSWILLATVLFIVQIPVQAQQTTPTDSASTELAFLPAFAYDSDLGLILGGIASRYKYKDGVRPFYSFLNTSLIITTKGLLAAFVEYDKPHFMGTENRLQTEAFISRFTGNQYYGIGNYRELPDALVDSSEYYLFNSFSTRAEITLRKPLLRKQNGSQIDVFGTGGFEYQTPWGNDSTQLIKIDQPRGIDGSYITNIGGGLVWEARNNEFNPTSGFYAKAGFEAATEHLGSSASYFMLETDTRSYTSFTILKEITFANRLLFRNTTGNIPFWKLPYLGGSDLLRGYRENRFKDDNAILLNSELRAWLFEFPSIRTRLGGTIFTDIGRTFPNGESIENIYNDLKYTFGFGATGSFFTNEFIMRGDVGFSKEGYGIYFTVGYLF